MAGWIRVQERMPPDTKSVLVWCPERRNTYTATWRVPFWEYFGGNGRQLEETVTHWMPKPEPPQE